MTRSFFPRRCLVVVGLVCCSLLCHAADNGSPVADEITINIPGLSAEAKPLTLVRIATGSFQMGSPDTERGRWNRESPLHTVNFSSDFYMGKWELTQAQWTALMGSNPGTAYGVGDNHPVYNVSWDDIRGENGFLDKLNALGLGTFRLPSEAEWEYACRAGTATRFFFGDSAGECADNCADCPAGTLPGNRTDYMWYCGNTRETKPVGMLLPNQFGLFDMSGSLWEWCEDDWHNDYTNAPEDGSAWLDSPRANHRVLRGGCWQSNAYYCRSAVRRNFAPHGRSDYHGFRVCWAP